MPDTERLAALVAESRSIDRVRDATRLREIFAEAALLVDRKAQPKKWAAFRSMDAQVSENIDPAASPAAYREAPTELPKICTTAAQAHDRVADWIGRAAVGRSDHEKNR